MSGTTGPIVALGAITVVNKTVFHDEPMNWRIPVATGLLAISFGLAERAFPQAAEVLAWSALLAALVTRIEPDVPSPIESALDWWDEKKTNAESSDYEDESSGGSAGVMEV